MNETEIYRKKARKYMELAGYNIAKKDSGFKKHLLMKMFWCQEIVKLIHSRKKQGVTRRTEARIDELKGLIGKCK